VNPRIDTIITDLDNTLYDWFEFWYASFQAMLDVLVMESGVPQEAVEPEIRMIHQKYGTSEYSALIQELPCLRKKFPAEDLPKRFCAAIDAYRKARKETLRLYPTVGETLKVLKQRGVRVVGYTESRAYHAAYRVRRLGLDGVMDILYSPTDHALPPDISPTDLRTRPSADYEFKVTKHHHTPEGEVKPNPHLLKTIIADVGAVPERTAYVGDSPMKDVVMAQQAGVLDIFARYGVAVDRPGYDLLRRVSHWPQTAADEEKVFQPPNPTLTLHTQFSEILDLLDFG
jgi:phosphoglycolate phosphatase